MPIRSARTSALIAGAFTLLVAGCIAEQSPTSPSARAPALSVSAADAAGTQHLVTFRGKGIPATFAADVERLGGSVLYRHEGLGLALVGNLPAAGVSSLRAVSGVASVTGDAEIAIESPRSTPVAVEAVGIESQANPATAILRPWQWNLTSIGASQAWAAGHLGSPAVTVAILDTGIDYDAIDFAGLVDLSRSASFVPSDDAITTALFPTRHPISDYNGHGTNVAQQVSSRAIVFAGVTSRTTLMGVKVLGADGTGSVGGILFGMLWAADHGADVINLSLGSLRAKAGGGGPLQAIINQVISYVNRSGVLVVASAGNDAADLDHNILPHPVTGEPIHVPSMEKDYCTATHVICVSSFGPVSATGNPYVASVFTNFGRSAIDVAGPGGNFGTAVSAWPWGPDQLSWVWSLCPRTLLAFDDEGEIVGLPCSSGIFVSAAVGTSQATPHVSGLAALLIAQRGSGKPAQIKSAIRQAAVQVGQGGNDPYFGKGRIDIPAALGLN